MSRINPIQWRSASGAISADMLHGGVNIRVSSGRTYIGSDLSTEEADDLAKFIIDCGIAERVEQAARQ